MNKQMFLGRRGRKDKVDTKSHKMGINIQIFQNFYKITKYVLT